MEKVQESLLHEFKEFTFFSFLFALGCAYLTLDRLPSYPISVISWFILLNSVANALVLPLIIFKNKDLKKGLRFSDMGILFPESEAVSSWDNIALTYQNKKIFKYHDYYNLSFSYGDNNHFEYPLANYNQSSLIELTKKYSPKDHELYNIVREYAQRKNLDF